MTNRERFHAVLNGDSSVDRCPVMEWDELLEKWVAEGHLKPEEIVGIGDGNANDHLIGEKLGFDFNYFTTHMDLSGFSSLFPAFEAKRVKENPDGSYHYLNEDGAIVLQKEGAGSIPAEVGHLLKDRASWEEHYLPRLQYAQDRFDDKVLQQLAAESETRSEPLGLYCKSLFGQIRNWLGVEGISYLYADDEDLYDEIINTVGDLCYNTTKHALESGVRFDFAHFWEDICFKNGPLVIPSAFEEKVGPHYKKITANGSLCNIIVSA